MIEISMLLIGIATGGWLYRRYGYALERNYNIAKYRIRKRLQDL